KPGVNIMVLVAAPGASGRIYGFQISTGEVGRNDTRGNGDDAIAHDHQDSGDGLAQGRLRRYIAITYGGKRNHCPVYTHGDALKSMLRALYKVHGGAHDSGYAYDSHKEYNDLRQTIFECADENIGLPKKRISFNILNSAS